VVGRSPVAKSADVYSRLVLILYISGAGSDFGGFGINEADKLFGFLFIAEDGAEHCHRVFECVVKHTVGPGIERDHRHAELLLKCVLLVDILVLGDNDVRVAGEYFFGFRRLCVRSTDAAGGQGAEGAAERENIRTGNGIKHLGAFIKRGVVDILDTAQQRHITDVAVHSQRTRADAGNTFITAGDNGYFAAYHICNCDLFWFGC